MRVEVKHDRDWLRLMRTSERLEEVCKERGEWSNDGLVSAQSNTPAFGPGELMSIWPCLNDWVSQKHQNLQEKMTSEEVEL